MRPALPLAALLALALPAAADPLADALSAAAEGPLYAYDMIYETGEIRATGSVDPSQPEGSRVIVKTPAKADWPEDFEEGVAEIDKDADGDIWCSQFAEIIPADAELVSETGSTATYTFQPNADPDDPDDAKFMKHIRGEVTIDTANPAITSFRMYAPKPFKPAMVAKVNTFQMTAKCTRAPDGRTYVEQFNMKVAGSAMMQSFEERMARTISNLRATEG